MLLPFVKEENILNQKPFISDEVQFNLIHRISDDPEALLLRSRDNNIIVARSNPKFPMWIWVKDDTESHILEEALQNLKTILEGEERFQVITKLEIMEEILRHFQGKCEKVMEMESFLCEEVIMPQSITGVMDKPSLDDIELIAEFCVGFIYLAFGKEVSKDSQRKSAEGLINSGNLYVLKVDDEIVSMANIPHRSLRHTRINNVYTPLKHQKKGYASQLIALLSTSILEEEGLTPVLFTDLTNSTSNKVYKNVGYKECGKVHHYKITNNIE